MAKYEWHLGFENLAGARKHPHFSINSLEGQEALWKNNPIQDSFHFFFLAGKFLWKIISGLFFMFLKGHFDARFYWLASKKLVRWPPYWPLRIVVTILVLSLLKITDYEVDAFDAFDTNNQFSSFDLVLKFAFINKVLKSAREENKTNVSFLSSEYRIFFIRPRTW